jgi:hypothetical protein
MASTQRGAGHQVPAGEFVHRVGHRHAGQQHDQRGDHHRVEVERADEARDSDGDRARHHARDRFARFLQARAAARGKLQHADQQADQARGRDVKPRQAQQPRDRGRSEPEAEDLHRAPAPAGGDVECTKLRMALCDADAPRHDVFRDAVGLAQLVKVRVSGREADHARRIRDAGGATRIAEGQDHAGGIRPRLALESQALGDRDDRAFEALRGGAVGMQVLGDFEHELDALGIPGARGIRVRHCRQGGRHGSCSWHGRSIACARAFPGHAGLPVGVRERTDYCKKSKNGLQR